MLNAKCWHSKQHSEQMQPLRSSKVTKKKPNENGNRTRQNERETEIELGTEQWKGKLNCRKENKLKLDENQNEY